MTGTRSFDRFVHSVTTSDSFAFVARVAIGKHDGLFDIQQFVNHRRLFDVNNELAGRSFFHIYVEFVRIASPNDAPNDFAEARNDFISALPRETFARGGRGGRGIDKEKRKARRGQGGRGRKRKVEESRDKKSRTSGSVAR